MHKALPTIMVALLSWASSGQAQSVTWNIDKNHTRVGFTARHLAFAKVRGEFEKFDAKVVADEQTGKLKSFEATIEAASVDTGVEKRDNHLRSDDFFATKKHPKITARSKSITWTGNEFTAVVALTIRGRTHNVKFEGQLLGVRQVNFGQGKHSRAAFEAHAKMDRRKFGLNFNGLAEGLAIVGDEVEIDIEAELSNVPET